MEHHPEVGGYGCSGGGGKQQTSMLCSFIHLMYLTLNKWLLWRSSSTRCFWSALHKFLSFRNATNCLPYSANTSPLMYQYSVAFMVYQEGAASLHWSFTLAALKRTMGGTTMPPALMYVTTVLVSPFSPDTVWKACSPLTPITFCDFSTSCKPLSSMFHILFGMNSICHWCTHCTNSSKNFSIWAGFALIALAAEIF